MIIDSNEPIDVDKTRASLGEEAAAVSKEELNAVSCLARLSKGREFARRAGQEVRGRRGSYTVKERRFSFIN